MNYHAEILADSISPDGVRLTTMLTVYPRFIHSEMLRHRTFSHSVASSRAIPTEKQIEMVRTNPFVPATFNKRVKGMGVGEEFDSGQAADAKEVWMDAAEDMATAAERLNIIGLDKSRANRIMEPFIWVSDIITGTEWDNFFALRDHEAAQPEFQTLAKLMRKVRDASTPDKLQRGEWHLPLVDIDEAGEMTTELLIKISAGRIARESYAKSQEYEVQEASIKRAESLTGAGHWSPFEHQAKVPEWYDPGHYGSMGPIGKVGGGLKDVYWGNLRGWVQARSLIPNQDNFEKGEA